MERFEVADFARLIDHRASNTRMRWLVWQMNGATTNFMERKTEKINTNQQKEMKGKMRKYHWDPRKPHKRDVFGRLASFFTHTNWEQFEQAECQINH